MGSYRLMARVSVLQDESSGGGRWWWLHNYMNGFQATEPTLKTGSNSKFYVMCILPQ